MVFKIKEIDLESYHCVEHYWLQEYQVEQLQLEEAVSKWQVDMMYYMYLQNFFS